MTKQRTKRVKLAPGQVIKELRVKKEWTQAVLAEISGVPVSNLSNIESGRSRLGEDRAIFLAHALGVSPEFLFFPIGLEREDLKPQIKEIQKKIKKIEGQKVA